jgi:hypothetical protein
MDYGKTGKKILFYDTDKRHAELKIKLQYDGLGQSEFFRVMVTGYLEEDPSIMEFMDSYKESDGKQSGRQQRITQKETQQAREVAKTFASSEIENIFDIIEKENPEL